MKQTFSKSGDWSEHGESESGALPCAVILPDGHRVEIDDASIAIAEFDRNWRRRQGYIPMTPGGEVRVRQSGGGDDPAQRHGRYRVVLEVLAPRGSRFLFARHCPWCGDRTGEQELVGRHSWAKPDPLYHAACKAEEDALERHIQEQREADRKDREAREAHLRSLGYVV